MPPELYLNRSHCVSQVQGDLKLVLYKVPLEPLRGVVSRDSCQPLVLANTQKKRLALGSIPTPEKERRRGKRERVEGETGKAMEEDGEAEDEEMWVRRDHGGNYQ